MFIGNAFYICLEVIDLPKRYLLLIGRFITGMGRAFVTCGQAIGMTSGPALQLFFTPLTYPGISLFENLRFNLYTAPAYLAYHLSDITNTTKVKDISGTTHDLCHPETLAARDREDPNDQLAVVQRQIKKMKQSRLLL
uniref:Uncharacterized protein n=1 Tax=Ditylenchus dipsaci TaxID=166011 RepID=A0A915E4M3_9BILA